MGLETPEATDSRLAGMDLSSEETTPAVILRERASSKKDVRDPAIWRQLEGRDNARFPSDHTTQHDFAHDGDARVITRMTTS